ncbi:MAG: hypothetical protein E6471_18130, partial [Bradyrhizobium sp.]|nr:hypothetical protein [Bradyrhizobium sp.]
MRIESIAANARQILQLVLLEDEAMSARESVVGHAIDQLRVMQDDFGHMIEDLLQRSDRRLQSMDSVHVGSPTMAATKRSKRVTSASGLRRPSHLAANGGKRSREHQSKWTLFAS